ncbi:MAG TPA: amidase [Acidimicrobiales bacterium]|nr:amidase [Acidimicrobiales bacterium]
MSTLITSLDPGDSTGPRLAVKDLIDMVGVPTTAGSRALADEAEPAAADAACMAGARAAGARVVGKANLVELAYGASGLNEWFGTPVNPLDPELVPGGSSSGSAVAVGSGLADIAYGSDTGGSIRIPSAFCGTAGLKTTHGRISLEGVWPLSPSLDTVGPMARDVAGLVAGMALLEPGFTPAGAPGRLVGRLRPPVAVDPVIDAAVDAALRAAGLEVVDVALPEWPEAYAAGTCLLEAEAAESNRRITDDPLRRAKLSAPVAARLAKSAAVTRDRVAAARRHQSGWRDRLDRLMGRFEVLALPTVAFFAPLIGDAHGHRYTELTNPVNLAGLPALALPVPCGGRLPASLQIIGPRHGEELLLATAVVVEGAL